MSGKKSILSRLGFRLGSRPNVQENASVEGEKKVVDESSVEQGKNNVVQPPRLIPQGFLPLDSSEYKSSSSDSSPSSEIMELNPVTRMSLKGDVTSKFLFEQHEPVSGWSNNFAKVTKNYKNATITKVFGSCENKPINQNNSESLPPQWTLNNKENEKEKSGGVRESGYAERTVWNSSYRPKAGNQRIDKQSYQRSAPYKRGHPKSNYDRKNEPSRSDDRSSRPYQEKTSSCNNQSSSSYRSSDIIHDYATKLSRPKLESAFVEAVLSREHHLVENEKLLAELEKLERKLGYERRSLKKTKEDLDQYKEILFEKSKVEYKKKK